MADTTPPDYEKYTESVARDVSKGQQARKHYALRGSRAELDFTPTYRSGKEPEWIHESSDPKTRAKELRKYNKYASENRAAWRKEYEAREAFDKGDTGIPKIVGKAKKSARSKRKKAADEKASPKKRS